MHAANQRQNVDIHPPNRVAVNKRFVGDVGDGGDDNKQFDVEEAGGFVEALFVQKTVVVVGAVGGAEARIKMRMKQIDEQHRRDGHQQKQHQRRAFGPLSRLHRLRVRLVVDVLLLVLLVDVLVAVFVDEEM